VVRSDLGCDLGRQLFNQSGKTAQKTIEENIRTQIAKWVPYVKIDSLEIIPLDNGYQIKLRFSLTGLDNSSDLINIVYEM